MVTEINAICQTPSAFQRLQSRLQAWLTAENKTVTQYLCCPVSNRSFFSSLMGTALMAAAIVLCTDGLSEYGWALLCAAEAVRLVKPIIKEFRKEGAL